MILRSLLDAKGRAEHGVPSISLFIVRRVLYRRDLAGNNLETLPAGTFEGMGALEEL